MRQELPPIDKPVDGTLDQRARADLFALVRQLGTKVIKAGDPLVADAKVDNAFLLLAGTHQGFSLTAARTSVQGSPGARVVRRVTITADSIVRGVHFASATGSNNTAASLVDVSGSATVTFIDCTFERLATDAADWITCTAGCKLHFIGCHFVGAPTTGNCIANAGVAANVGVWASNKTGRPLGAATTTVFLTA